MKLNLLPSGIACLCLLYSISGSTQQLSSISFSSLSIHSSENEYPLDIDWDWQSLFTEPDFFEKNSAVFQFGIGFINTVNLAARASELDQIDVDPITPGINFLYERQVWNNFGAGIIFGAQFWKVPVLDYQYQYYTAGLRVNYHLNPGLDALKKFDPYVGSAAVYRMMVLTNTNRNISKSDITFHLIAGVRYYLGTHWAAFAEIGDDTTSGLKVGMTYYMR